MVVSINATVTRRSLLEMQHGVARSIVRLFAGTLLFLQGHVRSGVRDLLTQRGGRAAPWNTRVDNIFRVYSEGGRGQFSRGGVALIAVVHREFASVPSSSLTPVLAATSSTRLLFSRFPPARSHPSSSVRGHSPPESLRSAPREARGSTRCYTLGSNLRTAGATQTNARCARREGVRRIFVFAHSRANAHPSSCGGIFRREEDCPPSCTTGTRAAFFSRETLPIEF